MTARHGWAGQSLVNSIRHVRAFGGDVNRITTTPEIRSALISAEGGQPDSELQIMGIPVVADVTCAPGCISLTWYEE